MRRRLLEGARTLVTACALVTVSAFVLAAALGSSKVVAAGVVSSFATGLTAGLASSLTAGLATGLVSGFVSGFASGFASSLTAGRVATALGERNCENDRAADARPPTVLRCAPTAGLVPAACAATGLVTAACAVAAGGRPSRARSDMVRRKMCTSEGPHKQE